MRSCISSAFLTLVACVIATPGQQGALATPSQPDINKDDILILVNLTAKELKFDAVPNPTVEFPGNKPRTTVWVTDRQNLPDQVQPGVTYHDIGLQLRISSRFAEIERIVRDAIDESSRKNIKPAIETQQVPEPPQAAKTQARTAQRRSSLRHKR